MLLLAAAFAADTADWHAAQARQFLKKGWNGDAEAEVAAGLGLDPHHVELNGYCVQLARAAGDVRRALACAAAGAAATTGDLEARARLSQTEAWLRENFGWVEVRGPAGVDHARLPLVTTGMQLDAELATATKEAASRLAGGVALPITLALPVGAYTVSGEPLTIEAGQTRQLELPAARFTASAGRGRRLDLAAAALLFSGDDLANQGPGVTLELAVSAPAGPLRLGVGATWDARTYATADAALASSPSTAGGVVRASVPIEAGAGVFLSPGLALRVGQMPGVLLTCARGEAPLACTPDAEAPDSFPIYAHALGLTPAAELAAELVAGRWVLGVRGAVGHSFVLLPHPGELIQEGATKAWVSDRDLLGAGFYTVGGSVGVGW